MNIKAVTPRGYCKGVVNAIQIAKKTRQQYPFEKITMLGMIVHNKYVVQACEKMGIKCLDSKGKTRLQLLDEIDSGVVIITAHGANPLVTKKAKEKNLIVIDATCVDVIKTHTLVKEHIENGDVIFIGKKGHPEAEGIVSLSEKIHLVSNIDDINLLKNLKNVLITNQTTMSLYDIEYLINECLKVYPNAKVCEEICSATRLRQEAIKKLDDIDCLIVVGDPNSNNSLQLKNIGIKKGIKKAFMIENANDLSIDMIQDSNNIAVTSGASTPNYLTKQVLETLQEYSQTKKLNKQFIDINKII